MMFLASALFASAVLAAEREAPNGFLVCERMPPKTATTFKINLDDDVASDVYLRVDIEGQLSFTQSAVAFAYPATAANPDFHTKEACEAETSCMVFETSDALKNIKAVIKDVPAAQDLYVHVIPDCPPPLGIDALQCDTVGYLVGGARFALATPPAAGNADSDTVEAIAKAFSQSELDPEKSFGLKSISFTVSSGDTAATAIRTFRLAAEAKEYFTVASKSFVSGDFFDDVTIFMVNETVTNDIAMMKYNEKIAVADPTTVDNGVTFATTEDPKGKLTVATAGPITIGIAAKTKLGSDSDISFFAIDDKAIDTGDLCQGASASGLLASLFMSVAGALYATL